MTIWSRLCLYHRVHRVHCGDEMTRAQWSDQFTDSLTTALPWFPPGKLKQTHPTRCNKISINPSWETVASLEQRMLISLLLVCQNGKFAVQTSLCHSSEVQNSDILLSKLSQSVKFACLQYTMTHSPEECFLTDLSSQ